MFIGSHFCPPKPGRSAYHDGMGPGNLVDWNVSALKNEDRKERVISCQVPLSFHLGTYIKPPHGLQTEPWNKRPWEHPDLKNTTRLKAAQRFPQWVSVLSLTQFSVSLVQANLCIMFTSTAVHLLKPGIQAISALNILYLAFSMGTDGHQHFKQA